jgi:glutamate-1-semialdehyde aminotransferase
LLIQANKDEIAAIIVEPVAGNMGCIPPNKGFYKAYAKCVLIMAYC